MKRLLAAGACLSFLLGLAVVAVVSQTASAAITGTDHDFSSQSWSGGEICKPCHTPHNANASVNGAPLWNHAVTTAVFTVYGSSTMNAAIGQPGGASKLCLSCHDGTVAIDSFGNNTGNQMMGGGANVGTNLSNDHPISFTYDTALANADGELKNPATTPAVSALLFSNKVECASCHDAHGGVSGTKLLRVSNAGSALCLTCHNK